MTGLRLLTGENDTDARGHGQRRIPSERAARGPPGKLRSGIARPARRDFADNGSAAVVDSANPAVLFAGSGDSPLIRR